MEFVHKSFKEYLLAEYYLESLLENKTHRLNIGTPSNETFLFIDGLIDLLLNTEYEQVVEKYISQDTTSLLESFGYHKGQNTAIRDLKYASLHSVENENMVFFNVNDTTTRENIWMQSEISTYEYNNLWIHRWISLYILKKIDPNKNPDKQKLVSLIKYSSHEVPHYIKNLRGADFSFADLNNANLSYSDLRGVSLRDASLSYCNLSYVNLSGAVMSNVMIGYAYLHYANLTNATLYDAIVSNSNLSYANLSNVGLQSANLFGSNLSSSIMINCKYNPDFKCENADFSDAIIDNQNLSDHLNSNNGMNVPPAAKDKNELRKKLEMNEFDKGLIKTLLSYSSLP